MKTMDSENLLLDYVKTGSEEAFRELLLRYTDMVYSVAVRRVSNDADLARDVVQAVFIDLATKARTLPHDVMLGGWLHRHTIFVASTLIRSRRRRQSRERQASEMNAQQDHTQNSLEEITPVLDEAINELGEEDRVAIMLRFFEQLDLRSVGEALGSSEEAARKRVTRALEKLHLLLKERGVNLSAAALGTSLATIAVTPAPAGLAISVIGPTLASASAAGGATTSLIKVAAITKLKMGLAGVVVAALTTALVTQHRLVVNLRQDNQALRQEIGALAQLEAENHQLSNSLANAKTTQSLSAAELNELLRLRSEVGQLRRMQANSEMARKQNEQPRTIQLPQFVFVGGGVVNEDRQLFKPGLTLTEAISAQGGFSPSADKTQVRLTREENGAKLTIDVTAIEQGTAPDPELKPGDSVIVPTLPSDGADSSASH